MKFAVDCQAIQNGSKHRGVGRASASLMISMSNRLINHGHNVYALFNKSIPCDLDYLIKDTLSKTPLVVPVIFRTLIRSEPSISTNKWRHNASILLREHAVACLALDFIHIPAFLPDGWNDKSVYSFGLIDHLTPVAITHYDLIPLMYPEKYFYSPQYQNFYQKKVDTLKNADLLLAISEYSKNEAIEKLNIQKNRIVATSLAADSNLWFSNKNINEINITKKTYGIQSDFILYAPGGFDYRKNISKLIEAYSLLPIQIRADYKLVIASKIEDSTKTFLKVQAASYGINSSDYIITGYIPDEDLRNLYTSCFTYIFPSLHEGFGLPVLEAMCCGAPVIASNCSSIPEVVNFDDALFNPRIASSIADKLIEVIQNTLFRARLVENSSRQVKRFSWERSAKVATDAIERRYAEIKIRSASNDISSQLPSFMELITRTNELSTDCEPTANDIKEFRECYEYNLSLRNVNLL